MASLSLSWFVKNEKERDSVFQTFCYILSHAGIKKGYQTVTWFGNVSYSKMPMEKEPKITCCPVGGDVFIEIFSSDKITNLPFYPKI